MSDNYLKKDIERVQRKFDELMREGDIEVIEKKIEALNKNQEPSGIDKIWIDIYNDVLDLKKNKKNED
ncbi:hypothetical protein [Methanobacterium petrolearium]|uniref:hypothetical protein n=1 Tax=Methanobacterium petrolearium TaxID=710190 RepID=UPI001AE30DC7|nr:hypothetical protein [Methanobacterium petrolearium]MBP1946968.1 glucose-6-phosphate isomerase [Methanobacterium petrolearium]BDZ71486.1 hypothetical protein GCM10025861_20030 [Methanobacterium petrolearium]